MALRGSRRYRELENRVGILAQHLLSFLPEPPLSKTTYNAEELDLTRAYIVLVHAEIEAFLEELVLKRISNAKAAFSATGAVTPMLRRLVAYHIPKARKSWGEVAHPSKAIVSAAWSSYQETLKQNHGIKRENIVKLLYPLGIADSDLNTTWVAQMNSFGTTRGRWAHSTSIGATSPPDPTTECKTVQQLLEGLKEVEHMLSRRH